MDETRFSVSPYILWVITCCFIPGPSVEDFICASLPLILHFFGSIMHTDMAYLILHDSIPCSFCHLVPSSSISTSFNEYMQFFFFNGLMWLNEIQPIIVNPEYRYVNSSGTLSVNNGSLISSDTFPGNQNSWRPICICCEDSISRHYHMIAEGRRNASKLVVCLSMNTSMTIHSDSLNFLSWA